MLSALAFVILGAGLTSDCQDLVPRPLMAMFAQKAPGLKLLHLADLPKMYTKQGCYLVAKGDYNGDGKVDYAVLLTNETDNDSKLFVGIAKGKSWSVSVLPTFTDSVRYGWVGTAKSGIHTSDWAFDKPPFWMKTLVSKNDVIGCGRQESGYYIFALIDNEWHGVQEGD